jgi:hypothetical protein
MTRQDKTSWSRTGIVGAVIGLAILVRIAEGPMAQDCHFFYAIVWEASEAVGSVVMTGWAAYFADGQGFLEGFLLTLVFHWPLLCGIVGAA